MNAEPIHTEYTFEIDQTQLALLLLGVPVHVFPAGGDKGAPFSIIVERGDCRSAKESFAAHGLRWLKNGETRTWDIIRRTGDSHERIAWMEEQPVYSDRGKFLFGLMPAFGLEINADGADSFPRYYMSFITAVREIEQWLCLRLSQKNGRRP